MTTEQKDKVFLYQINVTRDCNLRCTHCYIDSEVKNSSKTMTAEQVLHIAKGIVEHMKSINYVKAEIHFIGGEPTMLGLEFFQKNIPEFRKIVENEGFNCDIMLVTNLLHDDILEMSKLFDKVVTSYEVDTRFVSLKGTYKPKLEQKWMEKVKLLQNNGIKLGVTTAVTQQVIKYGASRLLDYYYENGLKNIHFGFFIPQGDGLRNMSSVMPAFHETSQFLIETANWYLEKRDIDENLWVNPFESMLSALYNDEPLDDVVCPIIAGSIDINWDGNAVTCIEEGGAVKPDWAGNVFETSILSVSMTEKFLKRIMEAARPQKMCQTCDEYKVCKSGCGVLFKYYDKNLDNDCPGFKNFITFIRNKIEEGIKPRYNNYASVIVKQ